MFDCPINCSDKIHEEKNHNHEFWSYNTTPLEKTSKWIEACRYCHMTRQMVQEIM